MINPFRGGYKRVFFAMSDKFDRGARLPGPLLLYGLKVFLFLFFIWTLGFLCGYLICYYG